MNEISNNPIAFRLAKRPLTFGQSECKIHLGLCMTSCTFVACDRKIVEAIKIKCYIMLLGFLFFFLVKTRLKACFSPRRPVKLTVNKKKLKM